MLKVLAEEKTQIGAAARAFIFRLMLYLLRFFFGR